jgi:hypothetical protein
MIIIVNTMIVIVNTTPTGHRIANALAHLPVLGDLPERVGEGGGGAVGLDAEKLRAVDAVPLGGGGREGGM